MTHIQKQRWFQAKRISMVAGGLFAAMMAVTTAIAGEPGNDVAMGARLFFQCRACHTVGPSEPDGTGPNLRGIYGARAGRRPTYHYSAALAGSKIVWTRAALDQWLIQPTAVVPGTNMAFQGIASANARGDIIAYLETLKAPKP